MLFKRNPIQLTVDTLKIRLRFVNETESFKIFCDHSD